MIDPVTLFADGGPIMYIIAFVGLTHIVGLLAQLSTLRAGFNLMPLLWSLVAAQLMLGFLGSTMGMILVFQAVAHASEVTREVLQANGTSVALYTTAAGLVLSFLATLANGVVHAMVVNVGSRTVSS